MTYYSKVDYFIHDIRKSSNPKKKYETILEHRKTGKQKIIRWGSIEHEQYKDRTKLKLYAEKDHNDKKRRTSYRARHKGFIKAGFYSPGEQSWRWLWT